MEYDKLLYNPYIQFAMGLMAGNTGRTKGEAFSNAMQGGLTGINAAQRSQAYVQQVAAQTKQYEMLKKAQENRQAVAQKYMQDPNLDPMLKTMFELYGDSPKEAVDLYDALQKNKYNEAMVAAKLGKITSRGSGGGGGEGIAGATSVVRPPVVPSGSVKPDMLQGWRVDSKGNLYDPLGAKGGDEEKDWLREMTGYYNAGQPEKMIPLPEWKAGQKAKSDPNMMIYPKEYNRWVNSTGDPIKSPMTQLEAQDKGYKYVSEKQATQMQEVKGTFGLLAKAQDALFGEQGVYNILPEYSSGNISDRTQGAIKALSAKAGFGDETWQQNVRFYEEIKEAFVAQLARLVGHVGVLTERDVETVRGLMPKLTPSIFGDFRLIAASSAEAKKQFQMVTELLRGKGVDPAAVLGEINLPNTAGNVTKSGIKWEINR